MITTATKERPILFSTPMVQAILEGRKTQTRRIVKPQPEVCTNLPGRAWYQRNKQERWCDFTHEGFLNKCPYGQVGDVLWVRETWFRGFISENGETPIEGESVRYWYKADSDWADHEWDHPTKEGPQTAPAWKPSIHMPRKACRIRLRITDVRVERLQAISEDDSEAEGVEAYDTHSYIPGEAVMQIEASFSAKQVYETLWSKINGPESWASNPFVWVINFQRI